MRQVRRTVILLGIALAGLSSCEARRQAASKGPVHLKPQAQLVQSRLDSTLSDPGFRLSYPGAPKPRFYARDGCQKAGISLREPLRTLSYEARLSRRERRQIQDYYQQALPRHGWSPRGSSPPDAQYETSYYSKPQVGWEAILYIFTDSGGTEIGLEHFRSEICETPEAQGLSVERNS